MRIETLVRMGAEIARNNAALPHEEAVVRIAGHLRSFWTPEMIRELEGFTADHRGSLDPLLAEALDVLGEGQRLPPDG